MQYKVGIFSSGRDEAARNLLLSVHAAAKNGYLGNARILFVFVTKEKGDTEEGDKYLDLVDELGLEPVVLSSKKFMPEHKGSKRDPEWMNGYHERAEKELTGRETDIDLMLGYMLVVSPGMASRRNMLNLHPALPGGPVGSWEEVIETVIQDGSEYHGAQMQLLTAVLDKGPTVTYFRFPIMSGDYIPLWEASRGQAHLRQTGFFKKIREDGERRELPLVIETVRLFATGAVALEGGNVISSGEMQESGLDVTEHVERRLEEGYPWEGK